MPMEAIATRQNAMSSEMSVHATYPLARLAREHLRCRANQMTAATSAGSPTGTSTPGPLTCTSVDDADETLAPAAPDAVDEL